MWLLLAKVDWVDAAGAAAEWVGLAAAQAVKVARPVIHSAADPVPEEEVALEVVAADSVAGLEEVAEPAAGRAIALL